MYEERGSFWPYFEFLTPWFVLESHLNMLNCPLTWSHIFGISIPNLLMIQLTLLNWLPLDSEKYRILGFFSGKKVLGTSSSEFTFFSYFSRTEKFPFVTRYNRAKFNLDLKWGSGLPKEYSVTYFKKCRFSNSYFPFLETKSHFSKGPRIPTWKNCLI